MFLTETLRLYQTELREIITDEKKRPDRCHTDKKNGAGIKMNIIQKVFGTHSQRELKRIEPLVEKIESLRPEMMALSDEALKDKTREFKKRLADGETLDDLLPEEIGRASCRERV